jgi:hypothetical protein
LLSHSFLPTNIQHLEHKSVLKKSNWSASYSAAPHIIILEELLKNNNISEFSTYLIPALQSVKAQKIIECSPPRIELAKGKNVTDNNIV